MARTKKTARLAGQSTIVCLGGVAPSPKLPTAVVASPAKEEATNKNKPEAEEVAVEPEAMNKKKPEAEKVAVEP